MPTPPTGPVAAYLTVIPQVREVTMIGTADLAFWQRALAHEGLTPTPAHGYAQALLSAPDLRWSGVRFQELSLGVIVGQPPTGDPPIGLYLAHAYNSSHLMAFLERTLFQTPYTCRPIQVNAVCPASITVTHTTGSSLHATMAGSARRLWRQERWWEGTIFLPTPERAQARRRWFCAKLGGLTDAYAFDPAADSFHIHSSIDDRLLRLLVDAQFTPREWQLRSSATHARSRTYGGSPARSSGTRS